MFLNPSQLIRTTIKATPLWKKNGFILRELKTLRWMVAIALVCTFVGAALEGVTVGLIASFLQGLTNPSEPPIHSGIEWVDTWILAAEASPEGRFVRLCGLLFVMVWLRSLLVFTGAFYSRQTELNVIDRLRKRLFEQFQSLSLSYYSSVRAGVLIDAVTNQLNQVKQGLMDVSNLLVRGSTLAAYVAAMFTISWKLSLASVLLYTLLSVGITWFVRKSREASFAIPRADGYMASTTVELINGIRTIKASTAQDLERKRFYSASEAVVHASTGLYRISEVTKPVAEGAATTILLVIVLISFFFFIRNGTLQAASLLTFMFVLFRMMPLVSQVNGLRGRLGRYQGSYDSIHELLRTDNKPYLKNGTLPFSGLTQSMDLVAVDFSYGSGNPVLHSITLSIPKGQTVALVGASGAGKSTLADLIPRFYDPTQGKILVDGTDLRDFDLNSLRQSIAVVSQDTFIFNTSVKHNIAYGLEGVKDSDIYEAARLANALDFVQELPEGFDTSLGDRGVRLSGGQRQRIAIARAILRNPDILILDEATSALDSVSERLIQDSLDQIAKGRTVLAIAHRLSTIAGADKIVVLEQGRIVEQGSYQELLDQRGALWNYHRIQYAGSLEVSA